MLLSARSILLFLAVLSAVHVTQSRHRRRRSISSQKREALQAWEGEGGAVPVDSHRTAAVVTPADGSARS
ncbi:MAG TPA: hypothetical protein VLW55_21325 [Burkholderiaceae bacterium]|nr:hypothetical protein [Burkholderiaceae bacterium]